MSRIRKVAFVLALFLIVPFSALFAQEIWVPPQETSWQWQLSGKMKQSYDVDMYNIDMFENDATVVSSLHEKGRIVICYISAGSWEEWRPDANLFPASVIGKPLAGWPGENRVANNHLNGLTKNPAIHQAYRT